MNVQVCKRTLTPSWNEHFLFDITAPECELYVECFDHDMVGAHDFIGAVTIPLDSTQIADSSTHVAKWFLLSNPANPDFRAQVSLTILPVFRREQGQQDALQSCIPAHAPVTLTAHVVCGKDLKAMDRNGTSDPYVVLKVGQSTVKTRVVQKTLNPEWNETFQLLCSDVGTQVLTVSVYDKDLLVDDLIGQTVLPLSTLVPSAIEAQGKSVEEVASEGEWHEIYHESVLTGHIFLSLELPRPSGYVKL